ncbi:hypothetical protein ACVWYH_005979 [Bradyrhizobium sp. GM24.11]
MFALIAFEPVGHPKQRAEDRGAVVADQVHDTGFNNEAAEFDKMSRAFTALDLPGTACHAAPLRLDIGCATLGCAGGPSGLRSVVGAIRRARL